MDSRLRGNDNVRSTGVPPVSPDSRFRGNEVPYVYRSQRIISTTDGRLPYIKIPTR